MNNEILQKQINEFAQRYGLNAQVYDLATSLETRIVLSYGYTVATRKNENIVDNVLRPIAEHFEGAPFVKSLQKEFDEYIESSTGEIKRLMEANKQLEFRIEKYKAYFELDHIQKTGKELGVPLP